MAGVERRLRLLETRAASEERVEAMGGMSPFERACAEAEELAAPEELEEGERLIHAVLERGEERPDPSKDPAFFELWERMLARVSPGWETEARIIRDLLLRQLEGLEGEWEAAGRKHSTWQSDREFWMVASAAANRLHALQRGEPAVTDHEEARRIVGLVRAPETTREGVMQLVERS